MDTEAAAWMLLAAVNTLHHVPRGRDRRSGTARMPSGGCQRAGNEIAGPETAISFLYASQSMKHFALAALLFSACASTHSMPHVDHIMLGIADLDRGIHELESLTGIRAA